MQQWRQWQRKQRQPQRSWQRQKQTRREAEALTTRDCAYDSYGEGAVSTRMRAVKAAAGASSESIGICNGTATWLIWTFYIDSCICGGTAPLNPQFWYLHRRTSFLELVTGIECHLSNLVVTGQNWSKFWNTRVQIHEYVKSSQQ